MAGRGVRFTVLVDDDVELELDCASHTPLWVLKQQLAERTGVAPADQAIVRKTAKDDSELLEDDELSLGRYGIRSGSVLIMTLLQTVLATTDDDPSPQSAPTPEEEMATTLRAMPDLGVDADPEAVAARARKQTAAWLVAERRRRELAALALAEQSALVGERETAATDIGPADADHSYSGIVFDVEPKGSTEVIVDAIHVGGMLGEVSVFASDKSWAGTPSNRDNKGRRCGYYAVNDALSKNDFRLVYPESRDTPLDRRQGRQQPSWDVPVRIALSTPVRILPGGCASIYIHSSLPDDLGIQYRSTSSAGEVTLENEHLRIMPGIGHTGSRPFDVRHGWYRPNRTLCGSLDYRQLERVWCVAKHAEFPAQLRAAVFTVLCANQRTDCVLSLLPKELLLSMLEQGALAWNAFPSLPKAKKKKKKKRKTTGTVHEEEGLSARAKRRRAIFDEEQAAAAAAMAAESDSDLDLDFGFDDDDDDEDDELDEDEDEEDDEDEDDDDEEEEPHQRRKSRRLGTGGARAASSTSASTAAAAAASAWFTSPAVSPTVEPAPASSSASAAAAATVSRGSARREARRVRRRRGGGVQVVEEEEESRS